MRQMTALGCSLSGLSSITRPQKARFAAGLSSLGMASRLIAVGPRERIYEETYQARNHT